MSRTVNRARQDQRRAGPDEWHPCAGATVPAASIIPKPCATAPAVLPAALAPAAAHRACAGFTLIELMIGVAVAALLAGIALPSLEGSLRRAQRSDALVAMMQIQAAQERFRGNGLRYGSLAEVGTASVSGAGHYTLQTLSFDAEGYAVLATAIGAQARDADCRVLKLSVTGANPTYTSGPDSSAANSAAINRSCWML
jgi:type IV pilus assembly protein PilE